MKTILKLNDYLKFLPLLVIYTVICITKQQNIFVGDEGRYVLYADNLLNGFYAGTSSEYVFLWNGPGYPIFLMFFRSLNIPLVIAKLCNGGFIYLGLVYLFKTLKHLSAEKTAFFIVLSLGLYYPFLLESIPYLLTEALSFFLISLLCYHLYKHATSQKTKSKWITIVSLGYLILTKIIFGYVVITLILIILPFILFKKTTLYSKKYVVILVLSICISFPYLAYTYSITNKVLYFGNSGGMSLYWMSTPYENEFGDWHWFETLEKKTEIYNNHKSYLSTIKDLAPVEKDTALKEKAIENILNNKTKFFKNWVSNIGRILFNYPYSNPEKSNRLIIVAFLNSILLLTIFISIILGIKNIRKIEPVFFIIGLFIMIYLSGISLLSAQHRFLFIIFPAILIWVTYILNIFLKIELKKP